jgi:hypothetical protein
METSFSDRYDILKRFVFLKIASISVLILIGIGCESKKDYHTEPVPVFSRVINIDSSYTTVKVIATGSSNLLFCGRKGVFDSYSMMKFDSIPEDFDSLFLQLIANSASVELSLFPLKKEWFEDSTYVWNDIGSLIDTLNPIKSVTVDSVNPLIFIGDSLSLDELTISEINNFGLAVHSDSFYSFDGARENYLKLVGLPDSLDSLLLCTEDAYLIKKQFQDTIFTDSLLVGRGLSIRTHIFISRDSLPLGLSSIAEAGLYFDVADVFPFSTGAIINNSGAVYLPTYFSNIDTMDNDLLKFNFRSFFRQAPDDSVFHIEVLATDEINGIDLEKLGNSKFEFVWVVFP